MHTCNSGLVCFVEWVCKACAEGMTVCMAFAIWEQHAKLAGCSQFVQGMSFLVPFFHVAVRLICTYRAPSGRPGTCIPQLRVLHHRGCCNARGRFRHLHRPKPNNLCVHLGPFWSQAPYSAGVLSTPDQILPREPTIWSTYGGGDLHHLVQLCLLLFIE